jgi:hypothetical protein
MTDVRSSLERPPERLIRQFHVGQVGDDTIQTFLMKGFSLAICCQDCPATSSGRRTCWSDGSVTSSACASPSWRRG